MKVELRLYASLAKFSGHAQDAAAAVPVEVSAGSSIRQLLERLDVPIEKIKLVFRNGRRSDLDDIVKDGDRIGVFPPVAGG